MCVDGSWMLPSSLQKSCTGPTSYASRIRHDPVSVRCGTPGLRCRKHLHICVCTFSDQDGRCLRPREPETNNQSYELSLVFVRQVLRSTRCTVHNEAADVFIFRATPIVARDGYRLVLLVANYGRQWLSVGTFNYLLSGQ